MFRWTPALLIISTKLTKLIREVSLSSFVIIECLIEENAITNSYLVICEATLESIIIDPFFDYPQGERILEDILNRGLTLKYIINTHGHPDHISGNRMIKESTGVPILVHENDADELVSPWWMLKAIAESPRECPECGKTAKRTLEISEDERTAIMGCKFCGPKLNFETSPAADMILKDKDIVQVGNIDFTIIHTPGHTSGSIVIYSESEGIVFTGDTLQAGAIGGTRSPSSSVDDMKRSLERLMELPDDTIIYPGHGRLTTIGTERRENPFL